MRDLINQSTIWKVVGAVSAINGMVCFGLSSTYKMPFRKWGVRGLLFYVSVGLFISYLILWAKRIRVSHKVQGIMAALIFYVICLMSVVHDKLVSGKSDALSIIAYGSFALMSLSMSRKLELGFETGFSSFFLSLFATQLFKINWNLLPVALVFCSVAIIVRHHSESGVQFGSIGHLVHPKAAVIEIGDNDANEESQDYPGMEEVSKQSILDRDNEQNNEEGLALMVSILLQESWDQDHIPSENNMLTTQNGWMHSYSNPELMSGAPPREFLRDCAGAIQLNTWRFQVSEGTHFINPRLMYDPSRRLWVCLEEAALVIRMVEEAELELTMRPEMRILVKPETADSGDDSRTSSPTTVLQLREEEEKEEEKEEQEDEEEEEAFEECQEVTRI